MRKLFIVSVLLCISIAKLYADDLVWKEINVTALDNGSGVFGALTLDEVESVENLKVVGSINSYDIITFNNKMTNLKRLDLKDAIIVACDYDYGYGVTNDNQIGNRMFYNQSKYISIVLPQNITYINHEAFKNCTGLTSIKMFDGITYIWSNSFEGCSSLSEVELPRGIDAIHNRTFYGCSNLQRVVLPEGLKSIWTATVISSGSTTQGKYNGAFAHCNKLKEIVFPESLENIASGTFYNCSSLENILLPKGLKTIGDYAFWNCTALKSLRIPSSIERIESDAFSGCNSISNIYTCTIEPTNIGQTTFTDNVYNTAQIHVPSVSFNAYYWDSHWSQFQTTPIAFDEPYEYFYLNNDYELDDNTGRIDGTPDADVNPGGGLIVEGDGDQNLDDLHIHEGDDTGGSVIGDGNINANQLYIDIEIKKNNWYFFAFPYQIALADIRFSVEASYTFREYDGEERANNGYGGWKHMAEATEYLTANQGYIFRCSENGTLSIPVQKSEFGKFPGGDRSQDLATHTTTHGAEHASWNFMGNPYTSYYDIDRMLNGTDGFAGPIVVWNVASQSYETVRPGDDDYFLRPFEAYFVQKPEGQPSMGYEAGGRYTYQQSEKHKAAKQARRRAQSTAPRTRHLVNLTLSDGVTTDKTRVVYNEKCSADYEIGTDAAKFTASGVPQLWSVDQRQVAYSINERPEGEVRLAYTATKAGRLTIGTTRMDKPVRLRDNVTGTTHDLQTGDYTFETEAGTFNARFTLLSGTATAISGTAAATAADGGTVYTLDGRRVSEPQHGQVNVVDGKKVIK